MFLELLPQALQTPAADEADRSARDAQAVRDLLIRARRRFEEERSHQLLAALRQRLDGVAQRLLTLRLARDVVAQTVVRDAVHGGRVDLGVHDPALLPLEARALVRGHLNQPLREGARL